MALKINPPISKEFELEETDRLYPPDEKDPDPEAKKPTMVTIIQASTGAIAIRDDLFAVFKRAYKTDGTVEVTQRLSFNDITMKEVFLTMTGCNIRGLKDGFLFKFENGRLVDEPEFKKAWAHLPPEVSGEIHEKVLEMNPVWANTAKGAPDNDEDENPL